MDVANRRSSSKWYGYPCDWKFVFSQSTYRNNEPIKAANSWKSLYNRGHLHSKYSTIFNPNTAQVVMRWTTYNFSEGSCIQFAATNVLFPMHWGTIQETSGNILLYNSSIDLPLINTTDLLSPPNFTALNFSGLDDVKPPNSSRYSAGGWPRNYWDEKNV
jgi:hypothetical protein